MWEDRLLFTGKNKKEAYEKAKASLDTINAKLSEWKGEKIYLCDIEEMEPVAMEGVTYYYNIVKPLDEWNIKGRCDFSKIKFDKKEKYKKEWKKKISDLDIFENDNKIIRKEV